MKREVARLIHDKRLLGSQTAILTKEVPEQILTLTTKRPFADLSREGPDKKLKTHGAFFDLRAARGTLCFEGLANLNLSTETQQTPPTMPNRAMMASSIPVLSQLPPISSFPFSTALYNEGTPCTMPYAGSPVSYSPVPYGAYYPFNGWLPMNSYTMALNPQNLSFNIYASKVNFPSCTQDNSDKSGWLNTLANSNFHS